MLLLRYGAYGYGSVLMAICSRSREENRDVDRYLEVDGYELWRRRLLEIWGFTILRSADIIACRKKKKKKKMNNHSNEQLQKPN